MGLGERKPKGHTALADFTGNQREKLGPVTDPRQEKASKSGTAKSAVVYVAKAVAQSFPEFLGKHCWGSELEGDPGKSETTSWVVQFSSRVP